MWTFLTPFPSLWVILLDNAYVVIWTPSPCQVHIVNERSLMNAIQSKGYKNISIKTSIRSLFLKKVNLNSKNFRKYKTYHIFSGSLTRNSSTDLTDFKTRNEKRKVYNALAAASIFKNSAGVDTSRRQVVPLDAFLQFLTMFQKENLSEDEVNQLIEVCI